MRIQGPNQPLILGLYSLNLVSGYPYTGTSKHTNLNGTVLRERHSNLALAASKTAGFFFYRIVN